MKRIVPYALAAFVNLGWASATPGQLSPQDVEASVRCFEAKWLDRDARCPPGVKHPVAYLTPGKYPAATVEAVLRGLVGLALESDSLIVRSAALTYVAMPGTDKVDAGVPTVPFLEQIYRDARHLDLKVGAVRAAVTRRCRSFGACLSGI